MKLAAPQADKKTANSATDVSAPTGFPRLVAPDAVVNLQGELLTKQELAARCKVTVRTLEKWLKDGLIPRIRFVKVTRFYWPEVVAHLLKNFSEPGPKASPNEPASNTRA